MTDDEPLNDLDKILVVTLYDIPEYPEHKFQVELWTRDGMTKEELVMHLQQITDGFAADDVRRVR